MNKQTITWDEFNIQLDMIEAAYRSDFPDNYGPLKKKFLGYSGLRNYDLDLLPIHLRAKIQEFLDTIGEITD